MKNTRLKILTETGVMIAAAMALSQFKLYTLPNGGSVSLGAVPILIFSARHGVKQGMICGALAGMLMALLRPIVVHPIQFLLDYPLAYASLGIAGIVKWETALKTTSATILAHLLKMMCHTVAGAVFFIKNKDSLTEIIIASTIYNASYILPETLICIVIGVYLTKKHQSLITRINN